MTGSREAGGYVQGYAPIVGKDGKLVGGQAPDLRRVGRRPRDAVARSRSRRAGPPRATTRSSSTPARPRARTSRLGDKVRVQASETGTYTLVGVVGFGSADNLAGATFVLWEMPTAQRVLHRLGEFDVISVQAAEGVSRPELVDPAPAGPARPASRPSPATSPPTRRPTT